MSIYRFANRIVIWGSSDICEAIRLYEIGTSSQEKRHEASNRAQVLAVAQGESEVNMDANSAVAEVCESSVVGVGDCGIDRRRMRQPRRPHPASPRSADLGVTAEDRRG